MSNQQVGYTLQKNLAEGFSDFMSDLLKDCNLPGAITDRPMKGYGALVLRLADEVVEAFFVTYDLWK